MDKDFFYFKQFKLRNRDSALKINSDGVLLAAWCQLNPTDRVLDIGTGGGVISHILAQRYPEAIIHGIDLDHKSIQEAEYNRSINNNPLLSFEQIRLQDYSSASTFDHLISNPPFFSSDLQNLAKHDSALSLSELISHANRLMAMTGSFSLVLPSDKEELAIKNAKEYGLFIRRCLRVRGKKTGPIIRSLMEFRKEFTDHSEIQELYIREPITKVDTTGFSTEYRSLTGDLYLNF